MWFSSLAAIAPKDGGGGNTTPSYKIRLNVRNHTKAIYNIHKIRIARKKSTLEHIIT